jgi:hypothetical protein
MTAEEHDKPRVIAEIAQTAWFDTLTISAHPEPFESPLTLSLSKGRDSLRMYLSKDAYSAVKQQVF